MTLHSNLAGRVVGEDALDISSIALTAATSRLCSLLLRLSHFGDALIAPDKNNLHRAWKGKSLLSPAIRE